MVHPTPRVQLPGAPRALASRPALRDPPTGHLAPTLIHFFTRLCRDAGRKVFVSLDNLNVHKARDDRDGVAAHADAIALFYLSLYAPDLHPGEYLNGDLKSSVAQRAPARDRADLLRTATSRLRSLQRRPEQVKRFFHHPRVRYAA